MAEIEFFLEDTEILKVVHSLLEMRCTFVPDIHFPSPTATKLAEALEVQEFAMTVPHFFVVREDLFSSSVHMREVQTVEQHFSISILGQVQAFSSFGAGRLRKTVDGASPRVGLVTTTGTRTRLRASGRKCQPPL